ncbi:MAG: hypothetical protein FJX46_13135 [Alphaproteobacteria bacterium]|nr:hypothetical protein [Alphaproteobacteria bacterium]
MAKLIFYVIDHHKIPLQNDVAVAHRLSAPVRHLAADDTEIAGAPAGVELKAEIVEPKNAQGLQTEIDDNGLHVKSNGNLPPRVVVRVSGSGWQSLADHEFTPSGRIVEVLLVPNSRRRDVLMRLAEEEQRKLAPTQKCGFEETYLGPKPHWECWSQRYVDRAARDKLREASKHVHDLRMEADAQRTLSQAERRQHGDFLAWSTHSCLAMNQYRLLRDSEPESDAITNAALWHWQHLFVCIVHEQNHDVANRCFEFSASVTSELVRHRTNKRDRNAPGNAQYGQALGLALDCLRIASSALAHTNQIDHDGICRQMRLAGQFVHLEGLRRAAMNGHSRLERLVTPARNCPGMLDEIRRVAEESSRTVRSRARSNAKPARPL